MKKEANPTIWNYLLPVLLILSGILHFRKHGMGAGCIVPVVLGSFVLYMVFFNRALLKQVEELILRLWRPVAQVITLILLGLTYYLIFTPVSLMLKLMHKDFLNRSFKEGSSTYWINRPKQPRDYTHQF